MIKAADLNMIYHLLSKELIKHGNKVKNTTELNNVVFELTNIENDLINIQGSKKISLKYLLAENIWYASGSNNVDFIGKFGKKWLTISDDGKTSNSAYGYIIKNKFNFNQMFKVVDLLRKDPESRRAVIVINDANENVDTTLDEQCTMYLQYFIRNNKLYATTCMRSNDMWWGLPYDVPAFIAMQKMIAKMLNIECGTYTHFAGSLHVYDKDYEKIKVAACANKFEIPNYYIDWVQLYLICLKDNNALYRCCRMNPEYIEDYCKTMGVLLDV